MAFPSLRASPRLAAKKRTMPVAQLAEQLLCRRVGIVGDEEQVTEAAIKKFTELFQGKLPTIAITALFRLDCDLATAVEDALVGLGGDDTPATADADVAVLQGDGHA